MNNGSDDVKRGERLSALVDGELDAAQVSALCGAWREDAEVRRRWHDYQLIGDVLRSDDLASAPAHDSDFLAALRSRLADEPVMIAPAAAEPAAVQSAAVPARRSRRAMAIGAMAASFVVVIAGALTFAGLPTTQVPDSILARSSESVLGSALSAGTSDVEAVKASGELIRDARLDRYLAAHQQWTGSAKLGGHATYLRSPADAGLAR